VRDDLGERRFASTWRPPKNQRPDIVTLDLSAQGLPGSNQMFLASELIKRARAHAIR